ncbi:Putative pre-16S rRNA nuclease [Frankliniella fusca]|uniref:Pre-16S rRNA nuclease n=1 Tax=Frankliniella fusca TaxID=407009 RepID=A0AAE1GVU4_9NEOP|nr:Putative pre-16S rRNA nuclease [Frankliniella fusca]KAK3911238.1 Putative pre-16S rRNA nuclease [Frankliniella fusca]
MNSGLKALLHLLNPVANTGKWIEMDVIEQESRLWTSAGFLVTDPAGLSEVELKQRKQKLMVLVTALVEGNDSNLYQSIFAGGKQHS